MQQVHSYRQFILESIRASEAYYDRDAVQTVIDGKRGIGIITIRGATITREEFWNKVEANGLKTVRVEGNQYEAYIYFRPEAEQDAWELKRIAESYGGYLPWNATEEDSRRIGELLGYAQEDIDWYINKNYRSS